MFHQQFLLILKSRRGKAGLKEKVRGKNKKAGWDTNQDKLLGLIQLWADAFIMKEDQYPGF
jgi:hypothetical protein